MSAPAPLHMYQIYIRADAEQVWQAITDPAFTSRYFHRTTFEAALEPGGTYRYVMPDGSDAVVGTIEEVDPPRRLVMTWRTLYYPAAVDEPPSRVEWLLTESDAGVTKLTMIHRDLALSPVTSATVGDGWHWILQSMKSLLETGEPLPGSAPDDEGGGKAAAAAVGDAEAEGHRRAAVAANNDTWELLGSGDLTTDEIDDPLGRAYASTYHWRRAARERRRTQPVGRGWSLACTPSSATETWPSITPIDACRSRPLPASVTSILRTPTKDAPGRSPASVASMRQPSSRRPRTPYRSPTKTTARSSRAISPPSRGTACPLDGAAQTRRPVPSRG